MGKGSTPEYSSEFGGTKRMKDDVVLHRFASGFFSSRPPRT
jgi:hypothetical protein